MLDSCLSSRGLRGPWLALILLTATQGLTACHAVEPPRAPLRLGLNAWPGYEFLHLAQETELFDQERVSVRIVQYGSLGDTRRAFELGQIDGMATTIVEVLHLAHHSLRDARIVLVTDYSNGGDVIVARPPHTRLEDLAGGRVGVEGLSVNGFLLARAFALRAIPSDRVSVVRGSQREILDLYRRGAIDGVVTYSPYSADLLENGNQVVFSSAELPGEILDVVSFSREAIRDRPEEIEAVIRAFDRAVALAGANPDQAHAIMARRERLSVAQFRDALRGMRVLTPDERAVLMAGPFRETVRQAEDVLRAEGSLTSKTVAYEVTAPWREVVAVR